MLLACLKVTDISKSYSGMLANNQVSLTIQPGEIQALLGENGAGKSTLMKIIYGLVRPDAGEIEWEGQRVNINSPQKARSLGINMVFQHFSLFETLTVTENIALAQPKTAKGLSTPSSKNSSTIRLLQLKRRTQPSSTLPFCWGTATGGNYSLSVSNYQVANSGRTYGSPDTPRNRKTVRYVTAACC
jgi:ABC-type sugar transport system ATPase subunit